MVVQSVNQLKNFKFNCLHIPVWAKILGARIFKGMLRDSPFRITANFLHNDVAQVLLH